MHEFSLYGSVAANRHDRLVQQLAGVALMQPQEIQEVHLVFRARAPPALDKVQERGAGSGASQQQQQEFQKLKTMLQSGIFHVKLIGDLRRKERSMNTETSHLLTSNGEQDSSSTPGVNWIFEFKDTPEAAKQIVTTRLISRTRMESDDLIGFLDLFGYEYVNRYLVEGERFYTQDTTLFLHRLRELPKTSNAAAALNTSTLPNRRDLRLLDQSGSYLLQASIDITDGNNQTLRDRATKQLTSIQETLAAAVELGQVDRLALDTRITIPIRRN